MIHEDGDSFEYGIKPNNTIQTEAQNFVKAIRTGENQFNSAVVGARAVNLIEEISNKIR